MGFHEGLKKPLNLYHVCGREGYYSTIGGEHLKIPSSSWRGCIKRAPTGDIFDQTPGRMCCVRGALVHYVWGVPSLGGAILASSPPKHGGEIVKPLPYYCWTAWNRHQLSMVLPTFWNIGNDTPSHWQTYTFPSNPPLSGMEDVRGAIGPSGGSWRVEKTARLFALQPQGKAGKGSSSGDRGTYSICCHAKMLMIVNVNRFILKTGTPRNSNVTYRNSILGRSYNGCEIEEMF